MTIQPTVLLPPYDQGIFTELKEWRVMQDAVQQNAMQLDKAVNIGVLLWLSGWVEVRISDRYLQVHGSLRIQHLVSVFLECSGTQGRRWYNPQSSTRQEHPAAF